MLPEQELNGTPVLKPSEKPEIRWRPAIHDVSDLQFKVFPPLKTVVGEIIVEGLTMLCAGSKVGKTSMMLDCCAAVASGGITLGNVECVKGDTLYLSLEQGERSIQRRLTRQYGARLGAWPHFGIVYEWRRSHDVGLDALDLWLSAHPSARLVAIDTFVQFREPSKDGKPNYEKDYAAITGLQKLANRHAVAIVVLHHTRKADDPDDPLNTVLGSVGLTAGADTLLVISKHGGKYTLYGRGRDVEEIDQAIEFDKKTCRWTLLGDRVGVEQANDRDAVFAVLASTRSPVKTADIIAALGKGRTNVMNTLNRLVAEGEIVRPGHGLYALPGSPPQNGENGWWDN